MLLNGFFMTESRNPWPYADNVIVNLSGSQKFTEGTVFTPGKYRIEIAPGGFCSSASDTPGVPSGKYASYINIVETITQPFKVVAYCGGNATLGSVGNNLYSGAFKVNGITEDTQSPGIDVNHIFGAGGGNSVSRGTNPLSVVVHCRGGGNCLGNGSISTFGTNTLYYGAGSCLHLIPTDGVFGTNYIRAYHVSPYAASCGSAYGGAEAAEHVGIDGGNWGYRGGNSPYGNGGTTSREPGQGIGAGGKHVIISGAEYTLAAGARFNGTQWVDVPGSLDNTVTSLIKITYLEPLFS